MTAIKRTWTLLAAGILLAAALPAADSAFEIDPAQTKVEFTLGTTIHTVHGTFRFTRGNIHFDPATGKASGELAVDARTGESDNTSRDAKMHKEILESAKYPDIVFRPDRIDGKLAPQGVSQVSAHGMFTIHGASHEITLPMQVRAENGRFQVDFQFSVPYEKWGMKSPSTFILRADNHVDLTVHAVAKPAP